MGGVQKRDASVRHDAAKPTKQIMSIPACAGQGNKGYHSDHSDLVNVISSKIYFLRFIFMINCKSLTN